MHELVLFVCVHNAGRSQMAEAFFNALAPSYGVRPCAQSAGTMGAGELNSVVVEVMEEIGIEMRGHFPKVITSEMVNCASRIISMGCGVDAAQCPVKFLQTADWNLQDPKGQPLSGVREIRDQVRAKVEDLLDTMARAP